MASEKITNIFEEIKTLTILEMAELVKMLEEEFGVMIKHHLNIGDKINEYRTNLDGCGYVVAYGEDLTKAEATAQTVKNLINEMIERKI